MKQTYNRTHAVVRFAGDSGDGIQVIGSQFATASALAHNQIRTMPDFPSEIRAPEGTPSGVSSFQLHFGTGEVYSAGDMCDCLVAMNAAALNVCLKDVRRGGTIIVNTAGFTEKFLRLAGYAENPLETTLLQSFNVVALDITRLASLAVRELTLSTKETERVKNFFALGLMYWLFSRPMAQTVAWIEEKFAKTPILAEANKLALTAGWNYADSTETLTERYMVEPSELISGRYRSLTGNVAAALGLIAASIQARLPLFFGGYPITPASDILQTLVQHKRFGVQVFQAEDEIAAIASALGASFGGNLAATATSGPGMSLKTEALGLAVMAELPLVVINVQRAGPSTGMPTKTEQADLFQALYGRHGEAPIPVLAAESPADCFRISYEAARIALKYRTPVIVLSDAMLANGSEPWKIATTDELPPIQVNFSQNASDFAPFLRDEITLARDWAIPGTKGLEHRLGGLEKQSGTGAISQDAQNHAQMVAFRASKIDGIVREIPPQEVFGAEAGKILVISWGSTFGAIREAVAHLQKDDITVGHAHLRYIHPFAANLGEIINHFEHIIVAELNAGQLIHILQDTFCKKMEHFSKINGQPFKAEQITVFIREMLARKEVSTSPPRLSAPIAA
ncbi:MAG: 2-oxoacid:acceptor oxidoreductase subunit alpha [Ignavibacteria bacterium]|nr:2-oxoacid:acceptor oxidoreductase subunit alpha [Ignavibacteria bacterium]